MEETAGGVRFVVGDGASSITVDHTGTPPQLFRSGIGVVVEGTWEGDRFPVRHAADPPRRAVPGARRRGGLRGTRRRDMIAWLGLGAILVALGAAALLAWRGLPALLGRGPVAADRTRGPARWLLGGAVVAMAALELGLLTDDFSIAYIANNHRSGVPLVFTVAAGWAALEGSIVLWGLVLASFTASVFHVMHRGEDHPLAGGALSVLGMLAMFWIGLMATVANPFRGLRIGRRGRVQRFGLGALVVDRNAAGRQGRQSAPAEPHPDGRAPTGSLPGIRRFLGAVRDRGVVSGRRPPRGRLAGGDPPVDPDRLGFPHRRDSPGCLVELRGPGLGRLLGLGPGGERLLHPLAARHRLPPLLGGAGPPRRAAILELRPGDRDVLRHHPRNLPDPLGSNRLGPQLHPVLDRSGAARLPGGGPGGRPGPVRGPGPPHRQRPPARFARQPGGAFLLNNLLLAVFAFVVLSGTLFPLAVEAFSGGTVGVGRPFFDRWAIPLSYCLLATMGSARSLPSAWPAPACCGAVSAPRSGSPCR